MTDREKLDKIWELLIKGYGLKRPQDVPFTLDDFRKMVELSRPSHSWFEGLVEDTTGRLFRDRYFHPTTPENVSTLATSIVKAVLAKLRTKAMLHLPLATSSERPEGFYTIGRQYLDVEE